MDNLKTTTNLVKNILETIPTARDSDNYLYLMVLKTLGKRNGINIDSMSIPIFFLHLKEYGFPQFESVRRTRQKLQADFPELAGCKTVQGQQKINEEIYRDYARRKC